MGETLINSNQIAGGTGSSIKMLNVVQEGTLTRNGGIFSGFSANNYLQFGDNGGEYFFYKPNPKNFGSVASSANSFEMVFKIKYITSSTAQMLWCQGADNTSQLNIKNNGIIQFALGNGGGYTFVLEGTESLVSNTIYWIKISYDSNDGYKIYLSTDGTTYNLYSSENDTTKISDLNTYDILGKFTDVNPFIFNGEIDISQSYIKVNNEYWWKGVETL